jgi:CBS domain containing-hemolysin-like protein
VETLAGLVLWLADVVPTVGEVFRHQGLRITVKLADERRIRELLVETEAAL